MMWRLHCDLFLQKPLFVKQYHGSSASERRHGEGDNAEPADFKTVLEEVTMFVRKIKVTPVVLLVQLKALEKTPAKYPVHGVLTKYFKVAQGHTTVKEHNLYLGSLPQSHIIECVQNTAFNRRYIENPFDFNHRDIDYAALHVNGRPIPAKPLTRDFRADNYIRSYINLLAATGKAGLDEGNDIKYAEFGAGFTLLAFDLTASQDDDQQLNIGQKGDLRLEIRFSQPLLVPTTIICCVKCQNIIELDKTRTVSCDFTN